MIETLEGLKNAGQIAASPGTPHTAKASRANSAAVAAMSAGPSGRRAPAGISQDDSNVSGKLGSSGAGAAYSRWRSRRRHGSYLSFEWTHHAGPADLAIVWAS